MSNDKKYTKRGNYYGPVYDVDHLATFTVGSKLGIFFCYFILNIPRLKNPLVIAQGF